MAKLILPRIGAGMGSVDVVNNAFELLETAFDNTLSRDGASPNQMEGAIDLNGNALLNTGDSDDPNRVLTFQQMTEYVVGVSSGIVNQKQELQVATAAQTSFVLAEITYVPGTYNLAVYVDGVRKFSPTDYTEVSSSQVDFLAGLAGGEEVEFVTNEFLGTVNLPAHTHPFSQITNVPDYASRFPTFAEVTGKPPTFPPDPHNQDASTIVSGRLADARRGVYVQASQPVGAVVGDLWFY